MAARDTFSNASSGSPPAAGTEYNAGAPGAPEMKNTRWLSDDQNGNRQSQPRCVSWLGDPLLKARVMICNIPPPSPDHARIFPAGSMAGNTVFMPSAEKGVKVRLRTSGGR